jgi:hypothetical protein
MPILSCYVDDRTHAALKAESERLGRSIEDLAEAAIANAALQPEFAAVPRAGEVGIPEVTLPEAAAVSGVIGSELFVRYVLPDNSHDGINRKVWSGTPWLTNAWTDSSSRDPERRRAMIDWCLQRFGEPAQPFGPAPTPGRWREGNATVMGWTWYGFATEAEMREFEAAWPAPEGKPDA